MSAVKCFICKLVEHLHGIDNQTQCGIDGLLEKGTAFEFVSLLWHVLPSVCVVVGVWAIYTPLRTSEAIKRNTPRPVGCQIQARACLWRVVFRLHLTHWWKRTQSESSSCTARRCDFMTQKVRTVKRRTINAGLIVDVVQSVACLFVLVLFILYDPWWWPATVSRDRKNEGSDSLIFTVSFPKTNWFLRMWLHTTIYSTWFAPVFSCCSLRPVHRVVGKVY